MIGIEQIVVGVFIAIVIIVILALLWFAIDYGEKKMPFPMAWNLLRLALVLGAIFLAIAMLLALIGHPIIKF